MSDKLGPIPPSQAPGTSLGNAAGGNIGNAARTDPRQAVKSKLTSTTSATIDASISLETASAQLSALRNQATAAAASGDLSTLQQVAVRAVAIGVAAGQNAESLANTIAAKLAASYGAGRRDGPGRDGAGQDGATSATAGGDLRSRSDLTSLGLKPADIARLFSNTATSGTEATPPASRTADSLHELAALNARASAVIGDARSLLASMNQAIGAGSGGATAAGATSAASVGDQGVALNGLSQLLDQAENALTAQVYGIAQHFAGGGAAATTDAGNSGANTGKPANLDLKT